MNGRPQELASIPGGNRRAGNLLINSDDGLQRSLSSSTQRDRLREFLGQTSSALRGFSLADAPSSNLLSIDSLSSAVMTSLDCLLGKGSICITLGDHFLTRFEESVFAGLWCHRDSQSGKLLALEVGVIPNAVTLRLNPRHENAKKFPTPATSTPAMKRLSQAIRRSFDCADPVRIMNLNSAVFSQEELQLIDDQLDANQLYIRFSGYPSGQISDTPYGNIWRVRYFQGENQPALDTLEIGYLPEMLQVPSADLDQSLIRLEKLMLWLENGENFSGN